MPCALVFLSALAELLGGRLDVQDVINHLKGQPQRASITGQSFHLRGVAATQHATPAHRGEKERAGLARMQVFQIRQIGGFALGQNIDRLANHHSR